MDLKKLIAKTVKQVPKPGKPGLQATKREKTIPPHIMACKICEGSGYVNGHVCCQCKGSGRVIISSEVITYISAFTPGAKE